VVSFYLRNPPQFVYFSARCFATATSARARARGGLWLTGDDVCGPQARRSPLTSLPSVQPSKRRAHVYTGDRYAFLPVKVKSWE
jgi:hypothetical protein